ncbi:hypothetical protein [Gulosibacter macacae]|uniref:hypothetical protein n=1 Tax=Gulosibacter macacae TaxID=2488791 RepID=UPI00163B4E04|nr:hypothetical protein [Gulosibacter macacae]
MPDDQGIERPLRIAARTAFLGHTTEMYLSTHLPEANQRGVTDAAKVLDRPVTTN